MWTFDPIAHPRQFGGLITACGQLFLLLFFGANWVHALLITGGWSFGVLLAVNIRLRAVKREPLASPGLTRSSWSRVLIVSYGIAYLTYISLETPLFLEQLLYALAAPTAIFYAFCKFGCLHYACCGWRHDWRYFQKIVPLQLIEAVLSLTIAVLGVSIMVLISPTIALYFFMLSHGLLRILSRISRKQSIVKICNLDSGVLFLSGLYHVVTI